MWGTCLSITGVKAVPAPVSREFEGKLFSGHPTFEWLQAVFTAVVSARNVLKPGVIE